MLESQEVASASQGPSKEQEQGLVDAATEAGTEQLRADRQRLKQEKSHAWGAGYLTYKPPHSWQATCPRKHSHKHALGKNTRCTRTRSYATPEQEQDVLRQLRYWLNSADQYDSRLLHMAAKPVSASLLASPGFDERLQQERFPDDYDSGVETQNLCLPRFLIK